VKRYLVFSVGSLCDSMFRFCGMSPSESSIHKFYLTLFYRVPSLKFISLMDLGLLGMSLEFSSSRAGSYWVGGGSPLGGEYPQGEIRYFVAGAFR
jgi:hypothetical protein